MTTSTHIVVAQPSLVTNVTPVSMSTSASGSAKAGNANNAVSKGGIGGSGLPLGGLIGIIIGALVVLAAIAMIVTRTVRKRQRAKRTAARGSMFEAWQTKPAVEEEGFEKQPADIVMQPEAGAGAAGTGVGVGAGIAAASYGQGQGSYDSHQMNMGYGAAYPGYVEYGQQHMSGGGMGMVHGYQSYPGQVQEGLAPIQEDAAATIPGTDGLRDGMMCRVKVGFVRSLEDELGQSLLP